MTNSITKALGGVKKKVIDVASDVMSAPAQIKAARSKSRADSYTKALKLARSYDKAPSYDEKGVTDAGMARSLAEDVRDKIKKLK